MRAVVDSGRAWREPGGFSATSASHPASRRWKSPGRTGSLRGMTSPSARRLDCDVPVVRARHPGAFVAGSQLPEIRCRRLAAHAPALRVLTGSTRCHRLTALAPVEPSAPPDEPGSHVYVRARRTDAARAPPRASVTAPSRGARAGARALPADRAGEDVSDGIRPPSLSLPAPRVPRGARDHRVSSRRTRRVGRGSEDRSQA
jgi:hypothetical protein